MDNYSLSYLKGQRVTKYSGLTIVDLLRIHARLTPQRTALVHNDFSISYDRFNLLTDLLALELIACGVTPGSRVGILSFHNELAFISIFGIAKAGAAYVPLAPLYSTQRLLHIINDAGIEHVIAGDGLAAAIAGFEGTVIDGREFLRANHNDITELSSAPSENKLPTVVPEDFLMVEYTSGSTGNPKGVMVSHGNALVFPACYKRMTGLTALDAVASYASLSFIIHTFDFFAAILTGAEVHIISEDKRLDIKRVNEYFEANHITVAFVPFSFGHRFVLYEDNKSLRALSMAGEKFIPLPELSRSYKIYNIYGCTECSSVSLREIRPGDNYITVGTPVDNMDVYILDELGRIVSQGETGELCASGLSVSVGYINQAERTAEVFVKNPFNDETGYDRLYQTADLPRVTKNGTIEIIGRVDFQIKIRGYRIEPGEIDARLCCFPGVTESLTVAVENMAGVKQLVSYVVAGIKIDTEQLKNFASAFLPPYMVPQFVEQLPKLPRNINGKLDRASLPAPKVHAEGYKPPEGGTEEELSRIWAAVLGLEKENIGRESDFFLLGGDSLRVTVLSFEINKTFGSNLSPMDLVNAPVLKQQAASLVFSRGFKSIYAYSRYGSKAPLFFVHGGNSGPQAMTELALNLHPGRPVYFFENYNLHHPEARIRGIRAVARQYLKSMREITSEGPYRLCGWSYGGLIAFEIACLLEQTGEKVEHLYLLDPGLVRDPLEKQLNEKLIASDYYREYLAKDPLFKRSRDMGLDWLVENYRGLIRDMLDYLPDVPYRGDVTLFKVQKPDPVNPDASAEIAEIFGRLWQIACGKSDNGFGEYAPHLRVVKIDEIHDKIVRGEAAKKIASVIGGGL